jgi:hypothetical protein
MQITFGTGSEWSNFSIRVKSGQDSPFTKNITHTFHHFFDPLLENKFSSNATDEDC